MSDSENDKSIQNETEMKDSDKKDELTEKQRDQLDSIMNILSVSKQLCGYGGYR